MDKVFYWEQEYVADKTVYKPKKLRWLYSGPHTILKRLGDLQYEVEHCDRRPGKNKFTTGVNRLRPWKWSEYYDNDEDWVQWMVGEMDPPRAHLRGEGRPAVDDMVVIAVEQPDERVDDNGEPHMPFWVGKIMTARKDGSYRVNWYGNDKSQLTGTYRQQWVDTDDALAHGDKSKVLQSYPKAVPYDNDRTGPRITMDDISVFGFTLQTDGRLRMQTLKLISNDDSIDWTIVDSRRGSDINEVDSPEDEPDVESDMVEPEPQ